MATVKVNLEQIKKLKSKTNKEKFDALTDSEILEAALSDPDSVVPTEEELKEFKRPKDRD